jgi:hypothetical protein
LAESYRLAQVITGLGVGAPWSEVRAAPSRSA